MKNWLIGIGGTGARIVEAVVHMCAAGLGPDDLNIFLVDPDEANGNLARTTGLLADYARCQLAERAPDVPFFRTRIHTPKEVVWKIFTEKNRRLSDFIALEAFRHQRPALADLVSLLFSEEELTTPLNVGFRGHPSIGAVVMSRLPMDADPWRAFFEDIAKAQQHEARVFLAGSIFGGTGAAGVPTFGTSQIIKRHDDATMGEASKVWLGAALVLPYFSFDVNQQAEKEGMYARPTDFPLATKAALEFYASKDLAFDEIYLLGDSLAPTKGDFSVGRASQCNRAHYIEVVGALAAFDFFAQPVAPQPRQTCVMARRSSSTVDWKALPVTRVAATNEIDQRKVKLKLAAMSTFAYALATYGKEVLDANHGNHKDTWYKSHFAFNPKRDAEKIHDPRTAEHRGQIDAFHKFGLAFLRWITEVSAEENVHLMDGKRILDGQGRPFGHHAASANIGHFVHSEQSKGLDFSRFIADGLNTQRIQTPMPSSERFINLFAAASVRFCRLNLDINQ